MKIIKSFLIVLEDTEDNEKSQAFKRLAMEMEAVLFELPEAGIETEDKNWSLDVEIERKPPPTE